MKARSAFLLIGIVCMVLLGCIGCQKRDSGKSQMGNRKFSGGLYNAAFDAKGRIVLSVLPGFLARIDDLNGKEVRTLGGYGEGIGKLRSAYGLANDSKGRIYVIDQKGSKISRLDDFATNGWKDLDFSVGPDATFGLRGLCVDASDNLYITDEAKNRIIKLTDFDNPKIETFGTYGNGQGQLASPTAISVDSKNRIYIADAGNNRIVRIDNMAGSNWTSYGTKGKGRGEFDAPHGIAVDGNDNILVTDTMNGRIVRLGDMNGDSWTAYTPLPKKGEALVFMVGVRADPKNRIYYVDQTNSRICRIDSMNGDGYKYFEFTDQ